MVSSHTLSTAGAVYSPKKDLLTIMIISAKYDIWKSQLEKAFPLISLTWCEIGRRGWIQGLRETGRSTHARTSTRCSFIWLAHHELESFLIYSLSIFPDLGVHCTNDTLYPRFLWPASYPPWVWIHDMPIFLLSPNDMFTSINLTLTLRLQVWFCIGNAA